MFDSLSRSSLALIAGALMCPALQAQELSPQGLATAKTIYANTCVTCHGPGVAGAPKLGDKDAWAARIKGGVEPLYKSALKGKKSMPPKGGHFDLEDEDVKRAVDYMVMQAR